MKRTEENLSRLLDIRDEIEKQVRHLKRQASSAERYKVLRQEEREVNSEIKALHWQKLKTQFNTFQEKIDRHETERERIQAEQRQTETELEKSRLSQIEATDLHNTAQKDFYSLGNEVTRIEQQIRYTQEKFERWQTELETRTSRWEELSDSTNDYEQQIKEINDELNALRPHASSLSDEFRQASDALSTAERDMQTWNNQWEQCQRRFADSSKSLEVTRTKVAHYQQDRDNLAQRMSRLKDSRNIEQQSELHAEIAPLNDQLQQHQQDLDQCNQMLESIVEDNQAKKADVSALQDIINQKHEQVQTKEGRKASLEALQEAAFATDDEAVKTWLTEHGLTDYPRLGKGLQVEQGWEVAVETVLKGLFDAVCIDDLDSFVNNFSPLESGELVLVESARQQSMSTTHFTPLSSKVSSEWPVAEWLGNVFIASSLDEAKQMRHQLSEHQSVITTDGVWIGKHWLRVAKAVNNENSILMRGQELKQLNDDILDLKNELFSLEEDIARMQQEVVVLDERREQYHQQTQALNKEITDTKSQLTEKQTRYDNLVQREQAITQELNECHERDDTLAADLQAAETNIINYETAVHALEAERQTLLSRKEQCVSQLNNKRQQAQQAKQRADEYDIRLTSNENQLSVLQQTLSRDERQLTQLTTRRDELSSQLDDTDNPLTELREQLQEQLVRQSQFEKALHNAAEALESWNNAIAGLEKSKDGHQHQFNQMQTGYQQLQMDQQAVRVRQTTIQEQLQEVDLTLDHILENISDEANLNEWEQRSEKLASRITRLGPINLAAIEEHDTLVERKEYIDKQHADLEEALMILQNAIHKIDKETRSKFKTTFDKVNESFKELFPKVFGGGSASLELDNEDFLAAGVIVRAQPPGKRNSTIHMLSGGEKALTAIALVFGLFQLNPAPFCILDEVDAPLDDLNVGRYCRLISEMANKIQFIVISHNKVTIEACHRLLGITMQEPGVSRVVSVDIDEAVSLVEA